MDLGASRELGCTSSVAISSIAGAQSLTVSGLGRVRICRRPGIVQHVPVRLLTVEESASDLACAAMAVWTLIRTQFRSFRRPAEHASAIQSNFHAASSR
jgi:hypothetical protein